MKSKRNQTQCGDETDRLAQISKTPRMKEMAVCERPREKLLRQNAQALSNAELLAILIGSGVRNQSAISLASQVLAIEERGIGALSDCLPEELTRIKGIGEAKACQIVAAIEVGKRIASAPKWQRVRPDNPAQLASLFMEEARGWKQEILQAVLMNTKGEIITVEHISRGTLSKAEAHPREVFRGAIRRSAAFLILVHNHPSGNPEPSQNDLLMTQRLVDSGKILGIEVVDHLIIGDGIYLSMREQQMI